MRQNRKHSDVATTGTTATDRRGSDGTPVTGSNGAGKKDGEKSGGGKYARSISCFTTRNKKKQVPPVMRLQTCPTIQTTQF